MANPMWYPDFLREQSEELTHDGSRPSMTKLKKHVIPFVGTKWRNLGLELLETEYEIELDDIEKNYGYNVKICCRKMFRKWLNTDELASWDKLIKALRIVQLNKVVSDIEQLLLKDRNESESLKGIIVGTRGSVTYSNQPGGSSRVGIIMGTRGSYSDQPGGSRRVGIIMGTRGSVTYGNQPGSSSRVEAQLTQYEVFVQYYSKLNDFLKYYSHQLYRSASHSQIVTYFMEFKSSSSASYYGIHSPVSFYHFSPSYFLTHEAPSDTKFSLTSPRHFVRHEAPSDTELLLAEVAIELYSGNTYLFYTMLKVMKSNEIDAEVQKLAAEMEVKIKKYIPHNIMSSGSQLKELNIFMQYYKKLTAQMGFIDADRLCVLFLHAGIITHSDEQFIQSRHIPGVHEIILIRMANHLLSGNTHLFYKMLEILKSCGVYLFDIQEALGYEEKQTVIQEAQPVIQETQLTRKQKTQESDLEYKLFMQYHSKLSDVPSLVDLTSHFVAAKIITSSDAEAIANTIIMESQTAALRKLLNKISLTLLLGHGDSKLFDKMLEIMQIYGDDTAQHLAIEMLKAIGKLQSAVPVTSGYQSITASDDLSSTTMAVATSVGPSATDTTAITSEETCPISEYNSLSKIFDHHGGELIIEEHDVTITIPELAISKGEKVKVRAVASLIGPYQLPDGYDLVSVFVWIGADYRFRKLVKITIPHFASIKDFDHRVVILTANEKDVTINENGDSLLQLHESVYDYQYEVNVDYCDYYTNHFCSICYAERSFIYNLFDRLILSPLKGLYNPSRRVMVFFCYPDDYKTADKFITELCICYDVQHCVQTVRERYERSKAIYYTESLDVTIQKCQYFCLSHNDSPGWKIQKLGREKKMNVKDLDFCKYESLKNLRDAEELCTYPPRFRVIITCEEYGKKLDIEFKITLENNGVMASDVALNFPLPIIKPARGVRSDQQFTTDVNYTLTSTTSTTTTTATGTSSASNVSVASSYQSTTVSDNLTSTTMAVDGPSATDTAAITKLDQTALAQLPVSPTTADNNVIGSTFVKQNVIVQGGISYNIYQSQQPHLGVEQSRGSFNSLESFSTDISENVDVGTILPNLISHGLLTPKQRDYLTNPLHTSAEKQQELCGILLTLNEKYVKKFLQSLSETGHYDPHKQLLNKIQSKLKEATDDVD